MMPTSPSKENAREEVIPMEITIKGTPEEIAALVVALQGRQRGTEFFANAVLEKIEGQSSKTAIPDRSMI